MCDLPCVFHPRLRTFMEMAFYYTAKRGVKHDVCSLLQVVDAPLHREHQRTELHTREHQTDDYRRWWCEDCEMDVTQPYNLHHDLCHTPRDYAYCCHLCESRDSTDGGHQNHLRFAHNLFVSTKDIQAYLQAVPVYTRLEGCKKCEFRHPDIAVMRRHREQYLCQAWNREEAYRIRERERRAHLQERAEIRRAELRAREAQQSVRSTPSASSPPPPPPPPPGFRGPYAQPFTDRAVHARTLMQAAAVPPLMSITPTFSPVRARAPLLPQPPAPPSHVNQPPSIQVPSPPQPAPEPMEVSQPQSPISPDLPSMSAILHQATQGVEEEPTITQLQNVMAKLRKAESVLTEKARAQRVAKLSPIEQFRTLQVAPFRAVMTGMAIRAVKLEPRTVQFRVLVSQKLVPGTYTLKSSKGRFYRLRFGLFALHNACCDSSYRERWERDQPIIIDFLVVSENSGRRELFGSAQMDEMPPEGTLDVHQFKNNKSSPTPDAQITFTRLGLFPWW